MERYKRRFSIDSPLPYGSTGRRQSEPFFPKTDTNQAALFAVNRRYSTTLNTPSSNLLKFCGDSHAYGSNDEVRRLSMSLAAQEALSEEYGYTETFQIPLVYTPPPDKLFVSKCEISLKRTKDTGNKPVNH